jgi:hypothetical protein
VRKFLVAPGEYRAAVDAPGERAEIAFWGEWEAPSVCEELTYEVETLPGAPSFLHRPQPPDRGRRPRGIPQNTDPFVFGDEFIYTFCEQGPNKRKIRKLARGSVTVFGSVKQDRFVCDTVFVVAEAVRHTRADWRKTVAPRVSEAVVAATLEPMYAWRPPEDRVFTLYFGASRRKPVDGMFSFFPCLPVDGTLAGFLDLPSTRSLGSQAATSRPSPSTTRSVQIEHRSCGARALNVLDAGLSLGTRIETPG